MEYTFASQRQLSFVVSVGGRNLLIPFGSRNQAGVSTFMTLDEKVAQAVRRHSLSRRGIIQETTKPAEKPSGTVAKPEANTTGVVTRPAGKPTGTVAAEKQAAKAAGTTAAEPKEREYDNYTVARESICKELGIKKSEVRNPSALAKVAQEHGIIIKYKEM